MIIATAIIIVTAFLSSSSTMQIQKASAQMMVQSPPSVGRMGPGMMGHGTMMDNLGMMGGPMMMGNRNFTGMMNPGMMMMAAPNVTGSVPIFPTISKAIASQVHTSLVNATMIAEKTVGSNAHAVMSHLGIENGFLVYTICTIDSNNNMHRVIVDAGNGKVLSNQQIPMREAMIMHMMMHGGGMMMMGPPSMGMMHPDMMMQHGMMMGPQSGMGMMGGFHP